jgi:hypothetical protein
MSLNLTSGLLDYIYKASKSTRALIVNATPPQCANNL